MSAPCLASPFQSLPPPLQLSTASPPTDPQTNAADKCYTGAITPVSLTLGSSATSATFSGLPQYYPLVASVTAYTGVGGSGSVLALSPVYPFFYARPYPPGWESLGVFVDSKYLGGALSKVVDVSPNRHVFQATSAPLTTAANYPTAQSSKAGLTYSPSTYTANRCAAVTGGGYCASRFCLTCLASPCYSNLMNFKRSTATGLISDARDSIGLGFGTNTGYTVYAFATMSALASEQFLLARGQVREHKRS